jgi:hypothetical protein
MRIALRITLPALAALSIMAMPASAQVSATVRIGDPPPRAWGHEVVVAPYVSERYGDWHTSYRKWQPVTLYVMNGRYFARNVRGSRPVMVYRSHNQYFLPPQDKAWERADRRYKYDRRPNDDDYTRAHPRP